MYQAHKDGLVWQARDGFPLYVGIILVAGAVAFRMREPTPANPKEPSGRHAMAHRITLLVAVCVPAAQLGDFVWALRRYTVGLGPVLNPFAKVRGGWSPPVPAVDW